MVVVACLAQEYIHIYSEDWRGGGKCYVYIYIVRIGGVGVRARKANLNNKIVNTTY